MKKTGQDYIKNPCGSSISGFNCRQGGHSYVDTFRYPHERTDGAKQGGWNLADDMIKEGKIFYLHNFHKSHGDCPNGFAFPYGGTWVCNSCNNERLDRPWWIIKVQKDGNAWCCHGEDFENLQESDNYAFGDTREESIENYGDLMSAVVSL